MPLAVDVANIGHYEWVVPHHISSSCLVRVSESKEKKMPPHGLVYELDFRVNGVDFSGSGDSFTIYLGDAADDTIKNNLPGVSFFQEANGKVYIRLDDTGKEIGRVTGFNDRWHNIRILMDNVYDRISVILDGVLMFENIPRDAMAYFSPALSLSVGPGNANDIETDDVSVSAFYSEEVSIQGNPSSYPRPYALGPRPPFKCTTLFNEDFQRLNEKNGMGSSGWRTKSKQVLENNQMASGLKTLLIQTGEDEQVTVVKSFNIPLDFPFDVSDKNFEIRYNDDMFSESATYDDVYPGHGGHGASANNFYSSSSTTLSNSTPGISRTSELFNTYYIYTFDGRLLAEYDHNGSCTRDYIYAGNRLIAEYKPQTNEYFYYMTDQINSTRIITNDSGNVVFSEAAGPYGDVQKTWTNNYDPKMKFSGKEREGYSDLDYFGARYYDHKSYRFNSVDPIINREEALSNPQLWNIYAYCRNNPISFFDPDGRDTYVILYGDPGLNDHNVGNLFKWSAETRESQLSNTIGKKDKLVVKHVSTVDDISKALDYTDLKTVEYFGHGSWDRLYPGETSDPGTNLLKSDVSKLKGKFVKDGSITLNSCFSASGGKDSIAGAFSKHYKVPVTGSKKGMNFKGTDKKPTSMVGKMTTIQPEKKKKN